MFKKIGLKRLLSFVLSISLLISFVPVSADSSVQFSDVSENHWAYKSIKIMVDNGVVAGFKDGTFKPNDAVTRAQFAKMLVLGSKKELTSPSVPTFADVPSNSWAFSYVETVKDYLTGYKSNEVLYFRGDNQAVREDMAVAIVTAKGLQGQAPDLSVLDKFKDKDNISPAIKTYVAIAVKNNIMSGYGQGYFGPQNTLTRAEACQLMLKVINQDNNNEEKVVVGDQPTTTQPTINKPTAPNFSITYGYNYFDGKINIGNQYNKYEYAYTYKERANSNSRWYMNINWYDAPSSVLKLDEPISSGGRVMAIRQKASGSTPVGDVQILKIAVRPSAPTLRINYTNNSIDIGTGYDKFEYAYTTQQVKKSNLKWYESTTWYQATSTIKLDVVKSCGTVADGNYVMAIRLKADDFIKSGVEQQLDIQLGTTLAPKPAAPNFSITYAFDYLDGKINMGSQYNKYEYAYTYYGNKYSNWYLNTNWYNATSTVELQPIIENSGRLLAIRQKASGSTQAGNAQILKIAVRPQPPNFSINYANKTIEIGQEYNKFEYAYVPIDVERANSKWYQSTTWYNASSTIALSVVKSAGLSNEGNYVMVIRRKELDFMKSGHLQRLNIQLGAETTSKPAAPNFSITYLYDYADGKINIGSQYNKYEYAYTYYGNTYSNWYLNTNWYNATSTVELQSVVENSGRLLAIRQKASGSTQAGNAQILKIAVRPSAPSFTINYTNNTINVGNEYSKFEYAYAPKEVERTNSRWYLSSNWYQASSTIVLNVVKSSGTADDGNYVMVIRRKPQDYIKSGLRQHLEIQNLR